MRILIFLSVLILSILFMPIRDVSAQTVYSCTTTLYPTQDSGFWVDRGNGVHTIGGASLFPADYYYTGRAWRVEVLEIEQVRQPYSPTMNLLPVDGSPLSVGGIGTYYVSGTSLRIQTQFAAFRVRVTSCQIATPTPTSSPTPTPLLQYPTITPFYGTSFMCGFPSTIPRSGGLSGSSRSRVSTSAFDDGGSWGGYGTPIPTVDLPVTPYRLADGFCENIDGEMDTFTSYDEYSALVSVSSEPILNSLTFVSRQCYVIIPSISVPSIPSITDGFSVTDGLQVCVNYYDWQMSYGFVNVSGTVLSLLTFMSLWTLFALFRRG